MQQYLKLDAIQVTHLFLLVIHYEPKLFWPELYFEFITPYDFVEDVLDSNGELLPIDDVIITAVYSDEFSDGGETNEDIIMEDCQTVGLMTELEESSNGRVYTIELAVADEEGQIGTAKAQVHIIAGEEEVPAVEDPPAYSVEGYSL